MPQTALNDALLEDDVNLVDTLLDNGVDPNLVGLRGRNALHVAIIMCDDRATLGRILEEINNINAVDNEGNTALMIAAKKGYYTMVEDIMDTFGDGVDLYHRNNDNKTALELTNSIENPLARARTWYTISLLTGNRTPSRLMGLKNTLRF
jgi:ankyrin repeat protein